MIFRKNATSSSVTPAEPITVAPPPWSMLRREPAKEAFRLPLRPGGLVGHRRRERCHELVVSSGGRQIHRLAEIVRRRVVAIRQPCLFGGFLRRSLPAAKGDHHRRDAAADEVVLIAPHE